MSEVCYTKKSIKSNSVTYVSKTCVDYATVKKHFSPLEYSSESQWIEKNQFNSFKTRVDDILQI